MNRSYEEMHITEVMGRSEGQKANLKHEERSRVLSKRAMATLHGRQHWLLSRSQR